MSINIVECQLTHHRYTPVSYRFTNKFFWFALDLLKIDQDLTQYPMIGRGLFNLFRWRDLDHLDLGRANAKENYLQFFKNNGVEEEFAQMILFTNLRVLNYVFNPVSFVLATTTSGQQYAIIEIGNTFAELKPILVKPAYFLASGQFLIKTPKLFYVSPFIELDSEMEFIFRYDQQQLSIQINDHLKELVLSASLNGTVRPLSRFGALALFLRYPLITWNIIIQIHWHALRLWTKKIPYISKNHHPHLQQGVYPWKK